MVFLYDIIMRAYYLAIRIAALKNPKARDWINGRLVDSCQLIVDSKIANYQLSTDNYQLIWMHCSSLGEFEQGKPVLEALRKKYNDAFIVLTFFSPSGYNIRKNELLANIVTYLPLDTAQNANKFINALQPTMVFFVKYDIWWHYLATLHEKKIPTYLISALYRKEQWQGFSFQKIYLQRALRFFTHIFLQDETSFEILRANGFTNLSVCGDTRVERALANSIANKTNAKVENFVGNAHTIICGSTWLNDEKFILEWFNNPLYRDWKFIIAPHSISSQRIKEVQDLFKTAVLYSDANHSGRVLIINNIGLLSSLYRYAHIVYIGGGLLGTILVVLLIIFLLKKI